MPDVQVPSTADFLAQVQARQGQPSPGNDTASFMAQVQARQGGPAPEPADPRTQYVTNFSQQALASGSRVVADDTGAEDHAEAMTQQFVSGLKDKFPDVGVDVAGKIFKPAMKEALRGQLMAQHIKQHTDYLNSGRFPGRRSTWSDVMQRVPLLAEQVEKGEADQRDQAAAMIANGTASSEDYRTIGRHMARGGYDANAPWGQKLWDMAGGATRFMAEWQMLAGPARMAGAPARLAVAAKGAGPIAQAGAAMVPAGLARTVLRPDKLAADVAQRTAQQVGFDDNGNLKVTPGESPDEAFNKAFTSEAVTNVVFEGMGFMGGKPGPFSLAKVAKGVPKLFAASQVAQEAGGGFTGGQGGITSRLIAAKTPEERNRALSDAGAELALFTAMETGMGAAAHIDYRASGADMVKAADAKLADQGLPEATRSRIIGNMMERAHAEIQGRGMQGPPPWAREAPGDAVSRLEAERTDATNRLLDAQSKGEHNTPRANQARTDLARIGQQLESAREAARTAAPPEAPESPQEPAEPPAAKAPPEPEIAQPAQGQAADPVEEAGKLFQKEFPDAKETSTGGLKGSNATHDFYLEHNAETGNLRLDFSYRDVNRAGRQAKQAGDTEAVPILRRLIKGLHDTGNGVEYVAIGGRERAYAALLKRAGFEQTAGPTGEGGELRTWKPKAPQAEPDAATRLKQGAEAARTLSPEAEAEFTKRFSQQSPDAAEDWLKQQKAQWRDDFMRVNKEYADDQLRERMAPKAPEPAPSPPQGEGTKAPTEPPPAPKVEPPALKQKPPLDYNTNDLIKRALSSDAVGTESEILQFLKNRAKAKGQPAPDLKLALAELDRMVENGEVHKHTFDNDSESIYTRPEKTRQRPPTPQEIADAKAELERSNESDVADAKRRGRDEASVRRTLDGELQKAAQVSRAALAKPRAGQPAAGEPENAPAPTPGGEADRDQLSIQRDAPEEHADVVADATANGPKEGKRLGIGQELAQAATQELTQEFLSEADRQAQDSARAEASRPTRPPGAGTPAPGEPAAPAAGTATPAAQPEPAAAPPTGAQPAGAPGGGVAAGGDAGIAADAMSKARQFLTDEAGHVDLARVGDLARQLFDKIKGTVSHVQDEMGKLSGRMFPATSKLSGESGEAMARMIAAQEYARRAAPDYIDRVLGKEADAETRQRYGAAMLEQFRFRYAKQEFDRAAMESSHAADALKAKADATADPVEKARLLDARKAELERANEYRQRRDRVTTAIGTDWSPLKTNADYQAVLAEPGYQDAVKKYQAEFAPKVEDNFRRAQGLEDNDPIHSRTQTPGMPINAKAMQPGDTFADGTKFIGTSRGKLSNLKARTYAFSREAGLDAEAYEPDLGAMIENTLGKGEYTAAKAEALRTLVSSNIAQWGTPGQQVEGAKELPFVNPPKGTQTNERGESSLYIQEPAYSEVRQALQVDAPFSPALIKAVGNVLTRASLASTVEAAYHSKNLLTMMLKPGMSPVDLVKNAYGIMTKDPATVARLTELARIGALKPAGFEAQASFLGGKLNPLTWAGKFLDVASDTMRATASDAFDRLANRKDIYGNKLIQDGEGSKRDFINQLGQYNKAAQSKLIVLLRDMGIGPFATAGSNYYMQGLKSITLDPGVKANSTAGQVQLRAEMLARTAGILATVGVANFLAWGNILGDDKTPLGAIKVGQNKEGRTAYFDLTALTGVTRGLRQTGLLALMQGARKGQGAGQVEDKATENVVSNLLHPAFGPPAQFAYTAYTGKNALGQNVAQQVSQAKTEKGIARGVAAGKAAPGSSQEWLNLQAALKNANPLLATLTGWNRPGKKVTPEEKIGQLAGPFGVKYAAPLKK
jgi:hypothetical protein